MEIFIISQEKNVTCIFLETQKIVIAIAYLKPLNFLRSYDHIQERTTIVRLNLLEHTPLSSYEAILT